MTRAPSPAASAARLLADAKASGTQLRELPAPVRPTTWEEVYAIHDHLLDELGPIGGWKVAPHDPRICVPVPQSQVLASPAELNLDPETRIELEIAARFGRDVSAAGTDIAQAVQSLHLAFEIVGSRFEDRSTAGPLSAVADLGSNLAVVVGPPRADWRSLDLAAMPLELRIDGRPTGDSTGLSMAEMLAALTALAEHAVRRGTGIRAGQVAITGARIGPLPVGAFREVGGNCAGFEPVVLNASST